MIIAIRTIQCIKTLTNEGYLSRHGKEDHTKNNIKSAAFMSAHLLWGKQTLHESIRDVNKRININIKLI